MGTELRHELLEIMNKKFEEAENRLEKRLEDRDRSIEKKWEETNKKWEDTNQKLEDTNQNLYNLTSQLTLFMSKFNMQLESVPTPQLEKIDQPKIYQGSAEKVSSNFCSYKKKIAGEGEMVEKMESKLTKKIETKSDPMKEKMDVNWTYKVEKQVDARKEKVESKLLEGIEPNFDSMDQRVESHLVEKIGAKFDAKTVSIDSRLDEKSNQLLSKLQSKGEGDAKNPNRERSLDTSLNTSCDRNLGTQGVKDDSNEISATLGGGFRRVSSGMRGGFADPQFLGFAKTTKTKYRELGLHGTEEPVGAGVWGSTKTETTGEGISGGVWLAGGGFPARGPNIRPSSAIFGQNQDKSRLFSVELYFPTLRNVVGLLKERLQVVQPQIVHITQIFVFDPGGYSFYELEADLEEPTSRCTTCIVQNNKLVVNNVHDSCLVMEVTKMRLKMLTRNIFFSSYELEGKLDVKGPAMLWINNRGIVYSWGLVISVFVAVFCKNNEL